MVLVYWILAKVLLGPLDDFLSGCVCVWAIYLSVHYLEVIWRVSWVLIVTLIKVLSDLDVYSSVANCQLTVWFVQDVELQLLRKSAPSVNVNCLTGFNVINLTESEIRFYLLIELVWELKVDLLSSSLTSSSMFIQAWWLSTFCGVATCKRLHCRMSYEVVNLKTPHFSL